MTLIKFEPLRELENFQNRIQKLFGDMPSFTSEFGISFNPKIDISDDEKNIYIEAEIPGVKKDQISISLEDNIVTIKGEKKEETEENQGKNYYRSERSYGSFVRSFTLPNEVNPDSCEAKFEEGILKIKIEKVQPKPKNERQIEIK
jgi:HSP20 family protein